MGVPRSRDSVLWCLRWVPYEDDKGRTHWEGCWRERGHHNCAVAMVERLTQAQEPVGYVVVYDNGKGDRDIHHGELWDYAEDAQMAADAMNGARNGFTYTVEPVGASPVASAPNTYNARDELDALAGAPDGALEGVIDVAGRMKAYGYDAETLRVLTEHIFGGAEIPMPASAPEPYDASKEPIALNFLDNIFDCWKMGGDAFDRFMRAQRRQIEDVLASAPVWPEPGAPAPATKPPLGKIRPSAPEEEREAGWKPDPCGICGGKRVTIRGQYPGCEDRLVCPTCLQERIDIVRKTLDPNTYRAVRATLTKDQTDG